MKGFSLFQAFSGMERLRRVSRKEKSVRGFPSSFLPFYFAPLSSLRHSPLPEHLEQAENLKLFKVTIHAISFEYLGMITICVYQASSERGNTHFKVTEFYFTSFSGHSPVQREWARTGLIGPMRGAIPTQSHNP